MPNTPLEAPQKLTQSLWGSSLYNTPHEQEILYMSDTKRWYASKAVWASLIMLLSIALRAAGIDLGPFEEELTNMILEVVTVGAAVLGLWGRITASKRLTA